MRVNKKIERFIRVFGLFKSSDFIQFCFIFAFAPYCAMAHANNYPAQSGSAFRFHQAGIELHISADTSLLSGNVKYQLTPQEAGLKSIWLMAINIEADSVWINGNSADFIQSNDSLIIAIETPLALGSRHRLEISYRANPTFGIHRPGNDLVWSSLFPKAVSAWVPSIPHPSIELIVDYKLSVPRGWHAIANGTYIGKHENSNSTDEFNWRTDRPIAITDVSFTAGLFNQYSSEKDSKFNIFYRSGSIGGEDVERVAIQIESTINQTEAYLSQKLPYSTINFLILEDHRWEQKTFSAGYGYIFKNGGEITEQANRIIFSQWFGAYQRALNTSDIDAQLFMQAFLSSKVHPRKKNDISPPSDLPVTESTVWDDWSFDRWIKVRHYFDMPVAHPAARTLEISMPETVSEPSGIYGWDVYEALAERFAGGYATDRPQQRFETQRDTLKYELSFNIEFGESDLEITFDVVDGGINDQIYVPVIQLIGGNILENELSLNGMGDRLSLSVNGWLDNIMVGELPDTIEVRVNKPGRFWMYQLRTERDNQNRLYAAQALGEVTDEPDLQLAITDLLRSEQNPEIRAALIKSLSHHTRGKIGTQPVFIQYLSDNHHAVRVEALRALKVYKESETVRDEVFKIITDSKDIALVNQALIVYKDLVPPNRYYSILSRLLSEDSNRDFAETILLAFNESDQKSRIKSVLPSLIESNNSWQIRNISFQILTELEKSPSFWQDVFLRYSSDPDPRFRYLVWNAISLVDDDFRSDIIKNRQSIEYDERIRHKINSITVS